MLTALKHSTRKSVIAASESRSNGPFLCPECRETVLLRKSSVRTSHFAHSPKSLCRLGALETEAHRKCKQGIYEALLKEPNVKNAALERSLKTCRPDISARINGVPVAIEVQISTVSMETIVKRTAEYSRRGIYVLWLLLWTPYLGSKRYRPRLFEKWIHAAYFGRVYYWTGESNVAGYRFEFHYDCLTSGKHINKRDSSRKLKRVCSPICVGTYNIAKDFFPKIREGFRGGEFVVPSARLFMEK